MPPMPFTRVSLWSRGQWSDSWKGCHEDPGRPFAISEHPPCPHLRLFALTVSSPGMLFLYAHSGRVPSPPSTLCSSVFSFRYLFKCSLFWIFLTLKLHLPHSWLPAFCDFILHSTDHHLTYYRSYLGEGNGNPFQDSCLENPMDRGAWRALWTPWGCKGSDKTEWLTHTHKHTQILSIYVFAFLKKCLPL